MKKLGLYTGARNLQGVEDFENWLGQQIVHTMDFIDGSTWASIENPNWFLSGWKGSRYLLELSIPIIPQTGGTVAEGANGDYDAHWRTLGSNLVLAGWPNICLRLGWEFNGAWYKWFAGDPGAFAEYWRRIVHAMRGTPGQSFRFDWCPTLGRGNMADPSAAWPGAGYVSRVGSDVYDSTWTPGDAATRWNTFVSEPYGLQWHADFAAAHNKPMTHPEWGLTDAAHHGGGDNPLFIQNMHDWIKSHNVAAACYFQHDAPDGSHVLSHFPQAQAKFKEVFG